MNQGKNQTKEEKAANVLKDVYKNTEDKKVEQTKTIDHQTSAEEKAKQLKGSDADVDHNVGHDDQLNSTESAEQQRGSDADVDKNA